MSKDLTAAQKEVHVAEIVYHGDKLLIPEGMSVNDAIDLLERQRDYLEEEVEISRTFDAFPWDGANALSICLQQKFGWAAAEGTPGFFGKRPPKMITIEIAYGQTKRIPWGRFSLPGVEGFIQTSAQMKNGRVCFAIVGQVKRKDEKPVEGLFNDIGEYLKVNSIYAGKAIKIRFRDDAGKLLEMPEPHFLDTSHISRDMLVYSKDVEDAIQTNLFTPIERLNDCIANGIPVKRGVLLGGPYGTGKTMAATVASRLAEDHGITYLYVPHSDELADAIEFAKQYERTACVIFCEDIDRAISGERSVEMDDILNILDGIDTKGSKIITVLTTNHLENINPAMLRPGRLDAIINVNAPDAEAVERLIRLYGEGTIAQTADLKPTGELLAGTIPAVIAEVVKRAKLVQLQLQAPGTKVENITGEAVYSAAQTMQDQIELLAKQSAKKVVEPTFKDVIGEAVLHALEKTPLDKTAEKVNIVHEKISRLI
ncbi:ATP-binding protein [Salmonella enterica]|nr:ATP-binding protein [Salmonella enterica]EAO0118560.1 ATP-binding protein [Salmonella enterica]EAO3601664.1 ATP-binding protein [Salmonella enterica]EAR6391558.1 ATP-binding protein [Salmonella enterica]EAV1285322.1 ATP-binding protein [Salmonella enterica]